MTMRRRRGFLPSGSGLARMRNPTALAKLQPGEVFWIWDRAAGLMCCFPPARGADWQGLWIGYDGRDAGAGARKSEKGGVRTWSF